MLYLSSGMIQLGLHEHHFHPDHKLLELNANLQTGSSLMKAHLPSTWEVS